MTIDDSVYCSMVHGGLNISLKDEKPWVQSCCLRQDRITFDIGKPIWPLLEGTFLRDHNIKGRWDVGCRNCESLEKAGLPSFRQGMNQGLSMHGKTCLTGPARIDIMFDISCNLACRTCGTWSSTMWQKHLKDIGEWPQPIFTPRQIDVIIGTLEQLDLSNLRQVVFCGGETLLGQEYWDLSRWLVKQIPDAKNRLTLCFQTNGTQSISEKNLDIIDECKLLKLHVSIDGVGQQFEYLRWPASWQQVTENLFELRDNLPGNAMFVIEQTISVLNALDFSQVEKWVNQYFNTNREGDIVDCSRHMANGIFSLDNSSSQELVAELQKANYKSFIKSSWRENPNTITRMIQQIKKFDHHRGQDFAEVFPNTYNCFKRFW